MKAILFLILVSLVSCKSVTPQENKNGKLFLSMQKTACLGTCPIYIVKFYNDGKVIYIGEENVPKKGEVVFDLNNQELQQIKEMVNALNVEQLNEKYVAEVTDLPSTIYLFKNGDFNKKVLSYYGTPIKLKEFENYLQGFIFSKIIN